MAAFPVRIFVSVLAGLILGVIGLLIGTWFGGNFATEFVFNNVRGYEATGQVGFILFALIGAVGGWQYMAKRK